MYTLIGSTTSPYVRKLRLFLQKENIPFQFKSINYLEKNDSQFLQSINPINKIPVLLINGLPLYDSRIIFQYIVREHKLSPLTREEENILSAIDGAMDTSINLFSLRRGGLDLASGNTYILRQLERIRLILDYLSPWVQNLNSHKQENWNFLTMSLYSYLYWGQFREILDLTNFPEMRKFLDDFKHCKGILETNIPS